jgi:hypothetical protein
MHQQAKQPVQALKVPLTSNDENEYAHAQLHSGKSTASSGKSAFDFEIYKEELEALESMVTEPVACSAGKENHGGASDSLGHAALIRKQPLQAHCNNLMDMSTLHSPMMLDDTIKFASRCETMGEEDVTASSDEIDDEMDVRKMEAAERDNVLMDCEEYAADIVRHLRQLEQVNRAKHSYLKQQQDITSTMRSILVDWLVEVSEEYKLHSETLYLAVNYTDRFLSKMSVLRGKLQLLGTAAMYIAAKYEEIFPPDVAEFVYITDDTYTKQQVLRMEHLILKVLNFHMNAPTANCFLLHFLRYCKADAKTEHLARVGLI